MIFFITIIFILGLCIGSFLNVVILRLEKKETFLRGKSYCPQCKRLLGIKDLIPLLSFILQKGRCRYCQGKISWQYPLVEFLTGFLFCLFFVKYFFFEKESASSFVFFIRDLVFICFLIIIFVYDLKYLLVSNRVVFFGIGLALFSSLVLKEPIFLEAFLTSLCLGGFFFFQYFFSKGRWIGLGDIGIGILIGFILGFSKMILVVFLAYVFGAIIGLFLVFKKRKTWKSELAFGPFLCGAAIVAMLFGDQIVDWYLKAILF